MLDVNTQQGERIGLYTKVLSFRFSAPSPPSPQSRDALKGLLSKILDKNSLPSTIAKICSEDMNKCAGGISRFYLMMELVSGHVGRLRNAGK